MLNELGVVYGSVGDTGTALARLADAERVAAGTGDRLLAARIGANRARAVISGGQVRSPEPALRALEASLDDVPSGSAKAELLVLSTCETAAGDNRAVGRWQCDDRDTENDHASMTWS